MLFRSFFSVLSISGISILSVLSRALSVAFSNLVSNFNIIDLDSLRELQLDIIFKEKILFYINIARRQNRYCLYYRILDYNEIVYRKFKYFNYKEARYRA